MESVAIIIEKYSWIVGFIIQGMIITSSVFAQLGAKPNNDYENTIKKRGAITAMRKALDSVDIIKEELSIAFDTFKNSIEALHLINVKLDSLTKSLATAKINYDYSTTSVLIVALNKVLSEVEIVKDNAIKTRNQYNMAEIVAVKALERAQVAFKQAEEMQK